MTHPDLFTLAEAPEPPPPPVCTAALVRTLKTTDQDFEWYPTTDAMIAAIVSDATGMPDRVDAILDIGAGDGRVLVALGRAFEHAKLYGIEKAAPLLQAQPDVIIPVGTEFIEQDLMGLPMDLTVSNPPYSVFEMWAARIIATVHTHRLYLVLPERWESSADIAAALTARQCRAKVIYRGDFLEADRRSRAHVHVIRITFGDPVEARFRHYRRERQDPFDQWFDANISTFDQETPTDDSEYQREQKALAKIRTLDTIRDLVEAFNEEYDRMQTHYRAIFALDAAVLKEIGVNKQSAREALKKRMAGLKHTYWTALFEHLDAITSRLTTKTKKGFLDRLTGQTAIAFTENNAYAVVRWAIKAANAYFDQQVIEVFRALSTADGVMNYKSNQRTWGEDDWRYCRYQHADYADRHPSHYALDYRIVLPHYRAINISEYGAYEHPGNLHTSAHEQIDDLIAVFGNLGFPVANTVPSRVRVWAANEWQDFRKDGRIVFQMKAYKNGNLHFRMDPNAIKALNIEASRLLGWIRSPADVVRELGYSLDDATRYFGASQKLGPASVRLLAAAPAA